MPEDQGKSAQNPDSLAFAKFKHHINLALEDAHYIQGWGDGNCGSIIQEFMDALMRNGLYSNEQIWNRQKKKKIPAILRTAVFERDAYRCKHCGGWEKLCADHIIPESKGGPTTFENLQTLCSPCNLRKGAN